MFSITYGTGEIKGELVKETIKIGNMLVENQVIGIVVKEEGDAFMGVTFFLIRISFFLLNENMMFAIYYFLNLKELKFYQLNYN